MAAARERQGLIDQRVLNKVAKGSTTAGLMRTGAWQEVLPGVLASATVEPTRELRESASMLWVPEGALSHFSAARKEGIWIPDNDDAWVTAPFGCTHRSREGLQVYRTRNFPKDTKTDGFHRWTPPARTVVDLAGVTTRKQLEAVLLNVIRNRKATAKDISAVVAKLLRRRDLDVLAQLLELWSPERETMLEDVLYGDVVAVVTEPVARQLVLERSGALTEVRIDVAVPELLLAFEADGLFFHSTDDQIAADQTRDRGLLKRGWLTVRFREGVLDSRAFVRREIREVTDRRRQDLRGRRAA